MTQSEDSHNRRVSSKRADQLGEAGHIADVLFALLKRASFDTQPYEELLRQINGETTSALQRSLGRIEPRRRFRTHGGHPLLDGRTVNQIFLDESGKSFPESPDLPQYFALGSVAFPSQEDCDDYTSKAIELKNKFFPTSSFTFHEPHIRNHKGWYRFGGDRARQAEFEAALDELIEGSNFVVFGVGIRKAVFKEEFIQTGIAHFLPIDAYALAILLLMERYVDYLAQQSERSMGRVTLESIGPKEDAEHQMDFARIMLDGTQWVPATAFQQHLETGLRFMPKNYSHPMELADMVAREIYEWVRNGCTTEFGRWPLFSKKIYSRSDGRMGTFGVKVFPDADIKDVVLEHRRTYGGREDPARN